MNAQIIADVPVTQLGYSVAIFQFSSFASLFSWKMLKHVENSLGM